jgi:hypothetical protein
MTSKKTHRFRWSDPLPYRLDFLSEPEMNTGCRLWWGHSNHAGYGILHYGGRSNLAHRMRWTASFGEIPPGLFVCHKCDTPACINPAHLFIGTHQDNVNDRTAKGRSSGDLRLGVLRNNTKINSETVRYIRTQAAIGRSQRAIGEEVGLFQTTVSEIVRRKIWGHIP